VADERARQARLRAALGLSETDTERIQRWMWAWDGLSLALCNGWDPFTARDVPTTDGGLADIELSGAGDGGATRSLAPWPFAHDRVAVRCEARRLSPSYEDEGALHRALAEAEPETLEFVLA